MLSSRQIVPNVGEPRNLEGCNVLFEIPALSGIRISQIAAGSRTSFVRTSDGRVLGWGANEFGFVVSVLTKGFEITFRDDFPFVAFSQANWLGREHKLKRNHGSH